MGITDSITNIIGGGEQTDQNTEQGIDDSVEGMPTDETATGEGGETSSSSSGGGNSTISRVPITDRDEAMSFAKTEWNKIRRGSGHSLEVQVFGSNYWRVGEWCKVYIPSLNEYTDMYITKIDNSNDSSSEWLTNITLMDYAPQISELDEDQVSNETGNSSEDAETTDQGQDSQGIWTSIAKVLQDNYEKPSDGWDTHIRAIKNATTYDPDIKENINKMTKKNDRTYVDVGHELCKILNINY